MNADDCEEVFEILCYMDKSDVMKISKNVLTFIKENRNKNYKSKIDKDDLFNFNNISENTSSFLMYIDTKFWNNNLNDKKIKAYDEIFSTNHSNKKVDKEEKLIPVKEDNSLLEKIILLIKKIWNR